MEACIPPLQIQLSWIPAKVLCVRPIQDIGRLDMGLYASFVYLLNSFVKWKTKACAIDGFSILLNLAILT
jgi:hypothetical protein